jgi:Protein of unknown function (DUF3515)
MTPAHIRRRPLSLRTGGVVVCTALLAATACSGAVELDPPDVDASTRTTCEALLDALPDELVDQEPREVSPDDALGQAWGDPAITVECGGDMPGDFDRFSPCEEILGVGWFVRPDEFADPDADLDVTTIGIRPVVAVHLPASYRKNPSNSANLLAELAAPIKQTLELVDPCE